MLLMERSELYICAGKAWTKKRMWLLGGFNRRLKLKSLLLKLGSADFTRKGGEQLAIWPLLTCGLKNQPGRTLPAVFITWRFFIAMAKGWRKMIARPLSF